MGDLEHINISPASQRRLRVKPGIGQNIALHASPAVRTVYPTRILSAFLVRSTSFSPSSFNPKKGKTLNHMFKCDSDKLIFALI